MYRRFQKKDDVVIQRQQFAIADTRAPGITMLPYVSLYLDLHPNESQVILVRHRQGARRSASSDFHSVGRIVDSLRPGNVGRAMLEGIQGNLLAAERLETKWLLAKWVIALAAAPLSRGKIISTVSVPIQVFSSDVTTNAQTPCDQPYNPPGPFD